jgi:hypothetical protein
MKRTFYVAVTILAGAMSAGCDQSSSSTPPTTAQGAKATQVVSDATAALKTQAQDLYDKAMTAIKANKLSDAETLVNKLVEMKSKLPPEWQTKVDEVKSMYDKAKAAGVLPKLGN